ncbi:EAL domain-containing protein [Nodosilinea sp. LEGE 07088]|uniref:bifunctional diguanylate cyclase/phosphodiesterase n=1 Tax=Nodosilinea sp. LEGE 07088 TaxID=2777968 RepID=UPI00187FBEC7|nr:GGDEF and EAL domain-containing protein [Nodosilinea sp. LEGE 07088]MBE9137878.1 EAL domain-containing protein [Nodosilinea sp. LEGE 07088]
MKQFAQHKEESKAYGNQLLATLEYQSVITQISQSALSQLPLVDLVQRSVSLVSQVLRVSGSDYWQVLSDGQKLCRIASTQNVFEPSSTSVQEISGLTHLLNAHEPIFFSADAARFEQGSLQKLLPGNMHGIGYIISGRDAPLGVLTVYTHQPHLLTPSESQFLQVITQLLVTAIERKRSEALLLAQTQVLEQVASGSMLPQILNSLCLLLEQELPSAFCSVLLMDEKSKTLCSGAAPSLPKDYAHALNGLVVGEQAGSCGTAAHRGEAVFVNDIAIDPLWAPFRDLALSHNINACWSIPFFSKTGEVLGTFALSHQTPCAPNSDHIQIMKTAAHLASIATKNHLNGERLRHQALYDDLTQLANRAFFTEQLQLKLRQRQLDRLNSSSSASEFAVLLLDIDRFKLVNDGLGHTIGDQFLQAFVQRAGNCIGSQALFARLGGDEFAILLDQAQDLTKPCQLADSLQSALAIPLKIGTYEVIASVSIGIIHSSGNYFKTEDMLRDADIAMYQAKANGEEKYVVFDQTMHASALARLRMEQGLRSAVEQLRHETSHPFELYYQPIVSLETGEILGFEALSRWLHPTDGMVFPGNFIPIAEETGLVVPLGIWVIEEGCRQLQQWQSKFSNPSLSMSFNVSARQFSQPDMVFRIQDVLNRYQLRPTSIKLEITESILLETAQTITERLEQLRAIGVQLSLDDFGTGYSSLQYLNDLPVDTLKIDRSFVQSLQRHDGKIIQAIIGLAQNLGMTVIAEGIETQEQLAYLKNLNCDQGQGYLFARPLSRTAAENILSTTASLIF